MKCTRGITAQPRDIAKFYCEKGEDPSWLEKIFINEYIGKKLHIIYLEIIDLISIL